VLESTLDIEIPSVESFLLLESHMRLFFFDSHFYFEWLMIPDWCGEAEESGTDFDG
jgi:hypothetical protein